MPDSIVGIDCRISSIRYLTKGENMKKFVRITTEESVKTHEVKHKAQSDILTQSRFLKNTDGRIKTTNKSQLLQA
jgi:hypothetical protein